MKIEFKNLADSALLCEVDLKASKETSQYILSLDKSINDAAKSFPIKGIVETIPAFTTILIKYNISECSNKALREHITKIAQNISFQGSKSKLLEIPVCFDQTYGLDLEKISQLTSLSNDDITNIILDKEYFVYMLGFMPGFAFMGDVDKRLFQPRLREPRIKVPEGSVAIANNLTCIYPFASPGGWNLVGRTPIKLWDINRDPKILLNPGDTVKYKQISRNEYIDIKEKSSKDSQFLTQ